LLVLLQNLAAQGKGGAFLPDGAIRNLVRGLDLKARDLEAKITVPADDWTKLVMLTTYAAKGTVDTAALQAVLGSDLLLEYDPARSRFKATAEYDLLVR